MSAASRGSLTSRGTAPLAAKSSTQRRPERASCSPVSTESRPQPKRRSGARGLAPQRAWAAATEGVGDLGLEQAALVPLVAVGRRADQIFVRLGRIVHLGRSLGEE